MGTFRWYVARCEQDARTGHWRLFAGPKPHMLHMRIFHPPGNKSIGLVRVYHDSKAALDTFDESRVQFKMRRIPLQAKWSTLKNVTALTTLLEEIGVNLSNIPDSMTGNQIISRIGRKMHWFERRRSADREVPKLRDGVEE